MSLEQPPAYEVKQLLLSDEYWQAPVPPFDKSIDRNKNLPVTNPDGHVYDADLAHDIGSLVLSASNGCTITQIENGQDLPEIHPRQFFKLIIDVCNPEFKYDPRRLRKAYDDRKFLRWARKQVPDYRPPTFEESLTFIYGTDLPDGGYAQLATDFQHGFRRIVSRKVWHARPNETDSQFAAMSPSYVRFNGAWSNVPLQRIPRVSVGELYSERAWSDSNSRARIVSAELVEVTYVDWKTPPEGGDDRKSKEQERLGQLIPNTQPLT